MASAASWKGAGGDSSEISRASHVSVAGTRNDRLYLHLPPLLGGGASSYDISSNLSYDKNFFLFFSHVILEVDNCLAEDEFSLQHVVIFHLTMIVGERVVFQNPPKLFDQFGRKLYVQVWLKRTISNLIIWLNYPAIKAVSSNLKSSPGISMTRGSLLDIQSRW